MICFLLLLFPMFKALSSSLGPQELRVEMLLVSILPAENSLCLRRFALDSPTDRQPTTVSPAQLPAEMVVQLRVRTGWASTSSPDILEPHPRVQEPGTDSRSSLKHLQHLGEQLLLLKHCRQGFILWPLANISILDPLSVVFQSAQNKELFYLLYERIMWNQCCLLFFLQGIWRKKKISKLA